LSLLAVLCIVFRQLDQQRSQREAFTMTTVQITLPDELAEKAANAGLLSAEAMEAMLREQLRRRAGDALQEMWQRMPQEELTPEIEKEIVEEVRRVRAERRLRGAS
jgi:post-segregation antitoxin (ccd killing protein)